MHSEDVREKSEAARKALGELSAARKREQVEARKRLEGLEKDENNVLHGTRVALSAISKDRQEAFECLGEDGEVDQTPPEPEPNRGEGNDSDEGETSPPEPEPEPRQPRRSTPRYVVADSAIGAILAIVAGLVATALLWRWATSGWILEMPTLIWGILKAAVSAGIVYVVALAVGSLGDVLDSRRTQWVSRGQSN